MQTKLAHRPSRSRWTPFVGGLLAMLASGCSAPLDEPAPSEAFMPGLEHSEAALVSPDATLEANRNRLIQIWAQFKGYSNVCTAWKNLSCSAKGSFLTITHRLQLAKIASYIDPQQKAPLDRVTKIYSIMGQNGTSCGGGDYNRLFMQTDSIFNAAMWYAHAGQTTIIDANGNKDWKKSSDIAGPHDPFNASTETSYGHPRGQGHFWWDDKGLTTPVCRADMGCVIDRFMFEMDQDYDWNHPSSTECSYDTGGCDMCKSGTGRASFSSGPGRMIYARQHPLVAGISPAPDYDWVPAGCGDKVFCGGCQTCEAQRSDGYWLGRQATRCSDVPSGPGQLCNLTCTLDGVTKWSRYPYGWISSISCGPADKCITAQCSNTTYYCNGANYWVTTKPSGC